MSSELSLAFMVIGLLAVAGAVVITLTRSRRAPVRPEETGSELKDELRELRSDLERRELRLVDREQRLKLVEAKTLLTHPSSIEGRKVDFAVDCAGKSAGGTRFESRSRRFSCRG